MARTLFVCAVLLAWVLPVCGEGPPPTETVIRLTVAPAAAPRPALKIQLLPELREMNPGNPILGYLKCFMEQNHFFFGKESVDDRERWLRLPLAELRAEQKEKGLSLRTYGGHALRRADDAARLDTPNWEALVRIRAEGIGLLVPEMQHLRFLASALKVRFRGQVGDRTFEEAIVSAKTMFALARHLGEHPTLIGNLVGIAIAHITIDPLQELIEQPGSPNLYWALTALPAPLVNGTLAVQAERFLTDVDLTFITETVPMSESDVRLAREKLKRLTELVRGAGRTGDMDSVAWLSTLSRDTTHLSAARKRLVASGLARDLVERFPPEQVVLVDAKMAYEEARDEALKWMTVPYWQIDTASLEASLKKAQKTVFEEMVPSTVKVRIAQARLEQRLGLLRVVEAVRLYAAAHEGKLPSSLDAITVPLPTDPFSGKLFIYKTEGQTAFIQGTPPKGHEQTAAYKVRYEVTVKK